MMNHVMRRFWQDQRGLAAVEYVVLTTGIAAVIIGAVSSAGAGVANKLNTVASSLGDGSMVDAVPVDPIAAPIIAMPIGRPIMVSPVEATADLF